MASIRTFVTQKGERGDDAGAPLPGVSIDVKTLNNDLFVLNRFVGLSQFVCCSLIGGFVRSIDHCGRRQFDEEDSNAIVRGAGVCHSVNTIGYGSNLASIDVTFFFLPFFFC